jgi:hypothetical protein
LIYVAFLSRRPARVGVVALCRTTASKRKWCDSLAAAMVANVQGADNDEIEAARSHKGLQFAEEEGRRADHSVPRDPFEDRRGTFPHTFLVVLAAVLAPAAFVSVHV